MNVGLPEVKQDFASIVERITLQPWTMLQFIIWLDLKLAEYKVNGYMVLDQSLSSIPDWLASLNIDLPGEDNSPSESVPLQEQYMEPTNTNRRESRIQPNSYRRELTAQSNVIQREVRTHRAFGDRRHNMVPGNQLLPARNQSLISRNQPAPARKPSIPALNQPVPARNHAFSPRRIPSASPQERRGAGYQRSASPITIDDEEIVVPENNQPVQQEQRNVMNPANQPLQQELRNVMNPANQPVQQEQRNVMNPGRPGMKRAAMQQPPNAPRNYTDIKHRKVTDTSSPVGPVRSPLSAVTDTSSPVGPARSPVGPARSPSSAVTDTSSPVGPARSPSSTNIPRRDLGSDNSHNIQDTSPSLESPTQPVQNEQQPQSDIGTVPCSNASLQDPSLSLDIKPIVSETLDDISQEATSQIHSDAAPLLDINFEMQEFLPAQSIGDVLFDSTSSEPVPTQLFVNILESRKSATATSTSATGSDNSSNQPNPVAGTSYGTRSQSDADFDDIGDAYVKTEPGEAEPDDAEPYGFNGGKAIKSSPSRSIEEDIQKLESQVNVEEDMQKLESQVNVEREVIPQNMTPFTIGKKRFAPNTRRDIALYAIIYGNTNAARKFTAELGRVVGESTVRQMKIAYLKQHLRQ